MIWSGLGLNYNSTFGVVEATDLPYLRSWGINKIRPLIATYNDSASKLAWETRSLIMKSYGFYVIYGITAGGNTLTAANWASYTAQVIIEATWAAANGIDEFQIGNEEEVHIDGTTLTYATLRSNLRTLAATIKALFPALKLSYSSTLSSGYTNWYTANEGIGQIDRIGFNVYPNTTINFDIGFVNFNLSSIIAGLGASKSFISEFGIHTSGFGSVIGFSEDLCTQRFSLMLTAIKNAGFTEAYVYNYTDQNDVFGLKEQAGDYRYAWALLLGSRRWYI